MLNGRSMKINAGGASRFLPLMSAVESVAHLETSSKKGYQRPVSIPRFVGLKSQSAMRQQNKIREWWRIIRHWGYSRRYVRYFLAYRYEIGCTDLNCLSSLKADFEIFRTLNKWCMKCVSVNPSIIMSIWNMVPAMDVNQKSRWSDFNQSDDKIRERIELGYVT